MLNVWRSYECNTLFTCPHDHQAHTSHSRLFYSLGCAHALQCVDRLTNFILADAIETGSNVFAATAEKTAPPDNNEHNERDGEQQQEGGSAGSERPPQRPAAVEAIAEGTVSQGVQQRHLGLVMIPGKHLVSVERLGGFR